MGRRSKTSLLDDIMDLAAILPWWLDIILAISFYFIFHHYATLDIQPSQGTGVFSEVLKSQLTKSFSYIFQYLIPIALGIGAIISASKQIKRNTIYNNQKSKDSIRDLKWKEFEQLISEAYRRQGYQVTVTEDGPDGGVDLILRKDGRKIFVQCKHWKSQKVGVKEIRELNGVVAAKGAYSGILVTSGIFTTEALNFVNICPIELIDGDKLSRLIPQIPAHTQSEEIINSTPACPICGSPMVKRTAKKGSNVGNQFWGCSTFPKCKGTMNII